MENINWTVCLHREMRRGQTCSVPVGVTTRFAHLRVVQTVPVAPYFKGVQPFDVPGKLSRNLERPVVSVRQ